jgi:hypothetical protein
MSQLLADCAALGRLLDPARPTASDRLQEQLGPELASMLVAALAGTGGAGRSGLAA